MSDRAEIERLRGLYEEYERLLMDPSTVVNAKPLRAYYRARTEMRRATESALPWLLDAAERAERYELQNVLLRDLLRQAIESCRLAIGAANAAAACDRVLAEFDQLSDGAIRDILAGGSAPEGAEP